MNDFYVYKHIRLDNGSCFYIGKGRGNRAYVKSRNELHDEVATKFGMRVEIVLDNLSQKDAYDFEVYLIADYVINQGYGIDIDGYRNFDNNMFLTNKTFGGDGSFGCVHTEEWKKQHSMDMSGDKNPMYGVNVWDLYTEEKSLEVRRKLSNANSGENNPMYGVSPKERMDEDTYAKWYKKRVENSIGEKNPNYGNHTLHDKVKDDPDLRIQYYSRKGVQNGRATPVSVYTVEGEKVAHFEYVAKCCEWLKETMNLKSKISSIQSGISMAVKNKKPFHNYIFKYED